MNIIYKKLHNLYNPPAEPLAEGEEAAIQTRLAAGNVNSVAGRNIRKNSAGSDDAVKQRIMTRTGLSEADTEDVYTSMISLMQNADLTINFKPQDLFQDVSVHSFKNSFELGTGTPFYVGWRDEVENSLFKYNSLVNDFDAQQVVDRIRTLGIYQNKENASFDPRIRPRYGALNIFNFESGAVASGQYGNSHLILKDYIKHRCTFTVNDSFRVRGPDKSEKLANMFYLDRIILNLDDGTFDVLCARMINQPLREHDQINITYIEAQIHSDILFSRDVKKIRLYRPELATGINQINEIIENIALVAGRNRIPVEIFP